LQAETGEVIPVGVSLCWQKAILGCHFLWLCGIVKRWSCIHAAKAIGLTGLCAKTKQEIRRWWNHQKY